MVLLLLLRRSLALPPLPPLSLLLLLLSLSSFDWLIIHAQDITIRFGVILFSLLFFGNMSIVDGDISVFWCAFSMRLYYNHAIVFYYLFMYRSLSLVIDMLAAHTHTSISAELNRVPAFGNGKRTPRCVTNEFHCYLFELRWVFDTTCYILRINIDVSIVSIPLTYSERDENNFDF